MLERYVQTQGCWLPAALTAKDSLEASISHLFLQAAQIYSADPERPGCLIIDGTRNCGDAEARALTAAMSRATWGVVRDRITESAPKLPSAEVEALADYVAMILVGLSGSARDGVGLAALQASAEIAASGFSQQLEQCTD